ncbi:SurA N-terminal domain-containing protein [Nocardioides sp. CFH 31398]|uniref:SurA N-terminal domain-containing protein n=1 Tax=Nocardioides sp. CFH 31398 TaxID=2919579 RepID=UPI001F06AFAD|nr:SurA N-terminal domain-containing protein [Nocardioides sp. CFH 31398]MCH1866195.1 SurA N-terminal domain-containing protein [Nocardioides sp. CFH 31398]
MKIRRAPLVLGHLLAAALLTLTACGGGSGDDADSPSADESSSEAGPDLGDIPDVVAEVNGTEIGKERFVAAYEGQLQQASAGGQTPDVDAVREQTANALVDAELLRQEAEARGITVTPQQVQAELGELAEQNQVGSVREFVDAVEEQGLSEDDVRAQVGTQLQIERLVVDEEGPLDPTTQELRSLYQQARQQQEQLNSQLGEDQQQEVPPFDQVRGQLRQQAVGREQAQVAQRLAQDLREDADIQLNV